MVKVLRVYKAMSKSSKDPAVERVKFYGLKDEKGNVIVKPEYKFHIFINLVHMFAKDKKDGSCYNVKYYDINGKEISIKTFEKGFPFNRDGVAVVKDLSTKYTNGSQYFLLTQDGFQSSFPGLYPEDAKFCCVNDLERAIEGIGAMAIKYAKPNILFDFDKKNIATYKNALKTYLKSLNYFNKTEEEAKAIINKEFELFNTLIDEMEKKYKDSSENRQKKSKIDKYIDFLVK